MQRLLVLVLCLAPAFAAFAGTTDRHESFLGRRNRLNSPQVEVAVEEAAKVLLPTQTRAHVLEYYDEAVVKLLYSVSKSHTNGANEAGLKVKDRATRILADYKSGLQMLTEGDDLILAERAKIAIRDMERANETFRKKAFRFLWNKTLGLGWRKALSLLGLGFGGGALGGGTIAVVETG
ncbi:hypothetical protein FRB99_006585, partial [Tulasnella sp. 403]